ncbi:MAG: DUF4147 domain-containing protein [Thiohalomonadaceae bacterium]
MNLSLSGMSESSARHLLLECYAEALRAVDGRRAVRERLAANKTAAPVYVLAIGKAATAMMWGALDALGDDLAQGLLITKQGYADPAQVDTRLQIMEAEHPVPGAASLAAGQTMLDFLASLPPQAPLITLISGGSSALVEVLPAGLTITQLQQVNDWLLASGWDIERMNQLRRSISGIKGGRLLGYVGERAVLNLLISDVPGDDPAIIGSGLLVPPRHEDVLTSDEHELLPSWLQSILADLTVSHVDGFSHVQTEILRSNNDARVAVVDFAKARGIAVHHHTDLLQGDAIKTGEMIAAEVMAGKSGLHVWGGETTVCLPPSPGRGGRCQSLALAAAQVLAGSEIFLLAAGTDGSDGPGEDAGALVDGETTLRAKQEGYLARQSLQAVDAGSLLEASGDLLQTGPTGSNVMDLVLVFKP